MKAANVPDKLGIYIHIPFCRSKCAYCDFYSLANREERMDDYQKALLAHLKETAPLAEAYSVDTVYFGGGTPTHYGDKRLRELLGAIKKLYHVEKDAEITLEANPDSVGRLALMKLRHAGFNRISMGMQTACAVDIVYEDEDLIVLNKAPGLSVHPGPGHYSDTLGNFLLYYYDSKGEEADFHPVHRLDRGTSGLMVAAKHPHAQEVLKNQLHTDSFCRTYLALCEGVPSPAVGTIDAPLGPKPGSLVEQMVREDGKSARTHYEVLSVHHGRALLRLVLDTGRTHQIRVHMAHLGHPLTGDFLYGTEDTALIPRPALHSARLSFLHPITGVRMDFALPLPADIEGLIHNN